MPDGIGIIAQVQVEERQASNAQRELGHFQRNIHWVLALALPALEHRKRRIGHDRAEVRQALVVEGWLHEPSLMQPGLAIVGEKSVAEEGTDRVQQR
jgi:hypothetical protein